MSEPDPKPLPLRDLISQSWALLPRAQRAQAGIVLVLILLGTALEILGVGLVIPVVTLISEPDITNYPERLQALHRYLGSPTHTTFTLWALGVFLFSFYLKNLFLFFSIHRQNKFLYRLQSQLASELVAGYFKRPYSFHLRHSSADLLQKVNGELATLIQNVLGPGLWVISEAFVVLALLALAMWVNPTGALIVIGGLAVGMAAYYHLFKKRVEHWGRQSQEHAAGMYKQMQHGLGGIKEVKLFGREAFFAGAFSRHAEGLASNIGRYNFLSQSSRQVIELLIITVLLGATMLLVWRGGALTGVMPMLAFFGAAAFRLMPSAQRLLANAHNIRYGARAVRLIKPDIEAARKLANEKSAPRPEPMPFENSIELQDIAYRYPGTDQDVVHGLDLHIPRGAMVGFQGESGAGKTTLVDLLMGLLDPTRGLVQVDGRSIAGEVSAWQANIGYVPQNIFLTDDTLRRNVAFGLEEEQIDDNRVYQALQQAQLGKFLAKREDGLNTLVGERGGRLSGGERQRIGIARALYHNPQVLVLDEATASLDLETEADFIQGLEALRADKTLILISHRLSTMESCDRRFRLQNGRLNPVSDSVAN